MVDETGKDALHVRVGPVKVRCAGMQRAWVRCTSSPFRMPNLENPSLRMVHVKGVRVTCAFCGRNAGGGGTIHARPADSMRSAIISCAGMEAGGETEAACSMRRAKRSWVRDCIHTPPPSPWSGGQEALNPLPFSHSQYALSL